MTYTSKETVTKKAVIWNMLGSVVSAASSFLLLLFVTRTVGADEGGIFSLAYTTSQILLTFGKFGIRSYQATDVNGKISADTYIFSRIIFSFGMIFFDAVYIFIAGYDSRKCLIFIVVCIIKMTDAIEDVFHGQLQKEGHLDKAGILLFIRNVFTTILFGALMYIYYDLVKASVITAVFSVLVCIIMNVIVSRQYFKFSLTTSKGQMSYLLKECFPLFLGTFLSLLIYNVPKYVIDYYGTDNDIAIYSILFMPTFVINLFSDFIFKPLLTSMAYNWDRNETDKIEITIKRQFKYIAGIMIVMIAGAYLIGTQILSWFYKVDVNSYKSELIVLMVAGGLSALVYLLYNVLTCMRKQNLVLLNYGIATVLIIITSLLLMSPLGVLGETIAYLLTEIVLSILMLFATFKTLKGGNK